MSVFHFVTTLHPFDAKLAFLIAAAMQHYCLRSLWFTDSGAEFTKAVEAKTAEAQKAFGGVVENLAKNTPAGTESVVAAFKSALTAGQDAIESAQTQAKKAVEAAQSNFAAATTQAVGTAKKAAKGA